MATSISSDASLSRPESRIGEHLPGHHSQTKPSIFDEMQPILLTEESSSSSRFWTKFKTKHERTHSPPEENHQSKYHKHALILLSLYVPLMTIPWTLSCVMSHRPVMAPSYYTQQGLLRKDVERIRGWMTAINVFNAIAGLITIPILTALVAQASAVYTERHSARGTLKSSHLFALADRVWTNPLVATKSSVSTSFGAFIAFAASVILLGSVQQPLYQALVSVETVPVATCAESAKWMGDLGGRHCDFERTHSEKAIGWDIEPKTMARVEQNRIVDKLINDLPNVSLLDSQANIWNDSTVQKQPAAGSTMGDMDRLNWTYFVAGLEQGTRTGVLREHVMRMNSSIKCERIGRSQFPSSCGGARPFVKSFAHGKNITRVCVPGNFTAHPWSFSRDRQDIAEELYLDAVEEMIRDPYAGGGDMMFFSDYTLHCKSSTSRGYFELGNYRNNYTWGPLLQTWPSPDEMRNDFNNVIEDNWGYALPSADGNIHLDDEHLYSANQEHPLDYRIPGPLTLAAIALFGNQSFMETATLAYNRTINSNDDDPLPFRSPCNLVPFGRLHDSTFPNTKYFPSCRMPDGPRSLNDEVPLTTWETLKYHRFRWLHGFNDTETAEMALSSAIFLANKATLTLDQWADEFTDFGCDELQKTCTGRSYHGKRDFRGRTIYSADGTTVHKPKISNTAVVVMSTYLAVQLVALAVLTWQIYRAPSSISWLDSESVTRILGEIRSEKEIATSQTGP